MAIRINMLSKADSVPGQGVGSAYLEQTKLVKELKGIEMEINSPKGDFDIYHIHSVNFGYRLRMNKKHINIVYVHFVPSENEGSIKLPKIAQFIFDKYVNGFYKKADELVVVNPAFVKPLESLGIARNKITYIPNYVDNESFKKLSDQEVMRLRNEYQIDHNAFVVLGCGQIQTRKGFDDFIEVVKNNPEITFLWAGGFSFGRITDGYKRYKKILSDPPKNLRVLGIVDRSKMNEIYNISDIFFMPSFKELFPMAILEAVNVGKPILLRDLNLYKPILFERYARGKSTDEFTLEIRKLKNDIDYYNKQVENSRFIASFYSKERLLEGWNKYYHRVYNKHKGIIEE
ncbi:MAG: glycosyltransferase family 4 protein [Bacilli bacterium]|nr:glycosyltransferase family 4 protein [Bacilli bacterium]